MCRSLGRSHRLGSPNCLLRSMIHLVRILGRMDCRVGQARGFHLWGTGWCQCDDTGKVISKLTTAETTQTNTIIRNARNVARFMVEAGLLV